MKGFCVLLMLNILLLTISACGGSVGDVIRGTTESAIYSQEEIRGAMDAAISYFDRHFDGCCLLTIDYIGDEKNQKEGERFDRYQDVIVLTSSFSVDSSGGDGSLNPNDIYTKWMWIMGRNPGTGWEHIDHGY